MLRSHALELTFETEMVSLQQSLFLQARHQGNFVSSAEEMNQLQGYQYPQG
jgi:hypothetical protein